MGMRVESYRRKLRRGAKRGSNGAATPEGASHRECFLQYMFHRARRVALRMSTAADPALDDLVLRVHQPAAEFGEQVVFVPEVAIE